MNQGKHRHIRPWVCGAIICALMLVPVTHADAALAPIRLWGELGYDFRLERFEEGDSLEENAGIFKLHGMTYIHQPWLAVVEGGIGLDLRHTDRDTDDSSSENITGDARLRLFPQSRFPFEVYAERSDSRTDTDLAGLDIERTRYGVQQRYTSEAGTAYRFRYEHSDHRNDTSTASGQDDIQEDEADLFQFGFNKAFDAHRLTFDSNLNRIDQLDSRDQTETFFSTLRHTYSPGPSLSAEDMLTYNVTDLQQAMSESKTSILQLNSYAFWRPATRRPLRVNTSFRALGRTNESGGPENTANSATGTLGATYEWSPRWLFNASAGVTGLENEDDSETQTFQAAGASYTSEQRKLAGFDTSWFAQFDARNDTDAEGSIQGAGASLGYSLGRNLLIDQRSSLVFNGSQSVSYVADTDDFNARTLLSNLSLTWSRRGQARSSLIRISASDSHSYASGDRAAGIEGNFQLVNLQASLDQRLGANAFLSGNLTVQASRDFRPDMISGTGSLNGEWTPTASADLSYSINRLFGVQNLVFRSTLRFISDSYLPLFDTPEDATGRDDKRWDNRLEYTIGRLQLRAIGRVSEVRDEEQAFLLFQVRRLFGDI
ncbi:MAG: hypothetical protein OEM43_09135 [Gammaproteobacteria bacterium]|nr:hypothetical protein [Gammaproteobacteria bacterium]